MKKKITVGIITTAIALSMNMTAFAGQWTNDSIGWHYDKTGAGNFASNEWLWIDGNNDGIAESYCFDGTSYMYFNTTTPDGYTVNASGAWVVDGVVQTKAVQADNQQTNEVSPVFLTDLKPVASSKYNVKKENVRTTQNALWTKVSSMEGFTVGGSSAEFYTGQQYQLLSMTIAAKQGFNEGDKFDLVFYGDKDKILTTYEIDYKTLQDISVNVSGQDYVKIVFIKSGIRGYGELLMKDSRFH